MTQKKLSLLMEAYIASPQVPFEPPIKAQEPEALPIVPTERWTVVDRKRLLKTFKFESVDKRNTFLTQLLRLEADCGHHAEIIVTEDSVQIRLWTKTSDSLTDLDKEYARTADAMFRDLHSPLPSVYLHHTVG